MFIVTQTLYPDNYTEVYVISDLQALNSWMQEHEFEGEVKQQMESLVKEAQETGEKRSLSLSNVSYRIMYIQDLPSHEWVMV